MGKLAQLATNSAERFKEQSKIKDQQIINLSKQVEMTRKQLIASQTKLKTISTNVMPDMTKNLEGKIKEVEMLKEMLRSSKIELGGKEREIKRLRSKLGSSIQLKPRTRPKPLELRKSAERNVSITREYKNPNRDINLVEDNDSSALGNNYFFKQNYNDANQMEDIGNLKELEINTSLEKLKMMTDLNLNLPEIDPGSEFHLPEITSSNKHLND